MENNLHYQDYTGGYIPPPPPPPPPPPQNYYQQGQSPQSNTSASSSSIVALIFGILSFILCPFFFGIVAWIMGSIELGKIKRGYSSTAGKGFASAGMWLGIVNTILCVLGILIYIALLFFVLSSSTTYSH